jgi:cytochrome c-type biogenesis protein CcmH
MEIWLFWGIVAALAALVGFLLLQALRRGPRGVADHPDLRVYRDQLAEIDRDLARGTLQADEAARLKLEVSRRLLDADRALAGQSAPGARGGLWWAGGAVLLAMAGSLGLYAVLGAPGYPDLPLSARLEMADETYRSRPAQAVAEAAAPAAAPVEVSQDFLDLMEKLRAAVKARPDDSQGLELLARNESGLGNFAAARAAQEQLLALLGDKASPAQHLMAAQIMVAAAGGYVSPEAEAELTRVLEKDPANGMALYLSGLMFAQVGRPDRAFALWEPLLAQGPDQAPWMDPIRTDIQAVADQAGIKYRPADRKGPTATDMAAAGEMSAEDRQAMIEGMVGQLEGRLLSAGGPLEDWLKLINALGVLAQPDRGRAALAAAETALAADPAALEQLRDAAAAAGFAP